MITKWADYCIEYNYFDNITESQTSFEVSVQRFMDMRNFFSTVKKNHRLANLHDQTFTDEKKAAREAAANKTLRDEKLAEQNKSNRIAK